MQHAYTGFKRCRAPGFGSQAASIADKHVAGVMSLQLDYTLHLHMSAGLQLMQASAAVLGPILSCMHAGCVRTNKSLTQSHYVLYTVPFAIRTVYCDICHHIV